MSDSKKKKDTNKKNRTANADDEVVFEDAADAGKSAVEKAKKALKACEKERKGYLDGWKRAKADALNEKKRQKDFLERERNTTLAKCILTILPIYDSVRAALEQEKSSNVATKTLRSGVEQIHTQCLRSFADLGVAVIDTIGESFDPHRHQSIGEQEVTDKKQGNTVVKVALIGASVGKIIIRPAMVRVGVYTADVDK